METIRILHAEHRSLGAVLHGMAYLVREIRYVGAQPQFDVFGAMVHYIESFTDRYHHPKEDRFFRLLRLRHPQAQSLLDRLEAQHRVGAEKIEALKRALDRYRQSGPGAFSGFATAASAYAAFQYEHMRLEETEAVPLARLHLTAEDWSELDASFADHVDPLTGVPVRSEYEKLFRRIVELAPPPLGVGAQRADSKRVSIRAD